MKHGISFADTASLLLPMLVMQLLVVGVLGLTTHNRNESWIADGGPLMLSSDGGSTCLALFLGTPNAGEPTIAFRVGGAGFLTFLDRLATLALEERHGARLTRDHVVDHEECWSIYFRDPDGNGYELTTYDHAMVAATLTTQ